MSTDWLDEGLTEEQRARFRSCWVMLTEQSSKKERVFTLRPYLYEQFFAPDAQRKAVPMILDILTMMTHDLPVLIHFQCATPDHPDAMILADCAQAFGFVVRDPDSPSFLLHPSEHLPLDLLGAMLFDPDSVFHVICHIPQRFLMSTLSARPPVPWEQNRYTCLPDRSFSSRKERSAIGTPYHQFGYPKNTVS